MSEPSDKSRVRTRSRAQSVSDKEKFILQQALAQGKNPEKVLKELREFKRVHHSSTVSSPVSEPKTPTTPKFTCPPTFNPSIDSPIIFVNKYEKTAIVNSWSENHKISYLANCLEGPAHTWFGNYISEPENQIKTWLNIKSDFLKEFSGEQPLRKLKFRLITRKQQDADDIKKYYYDLLLIANEIDPEITFAQLNRQRNCNDNRSRTFYNRNCSYQNQGRNKNYPPRTNKYRLQGIPVTEDNNLYEIIRRNPRILTGTETKIGEIIEIIIASHENARWPRYLH